MNVRDEVCVFCGCERMTEMCLSMSHRPRATAPQTDSPALCGVVDFGRRRIGTVGVLGKAKIASKV